MIISKSIIFKLFPLQIQCYVFFSLTCSNNEHTNNGKVHVSTLKIIIIIMLLIIESVDSISRDGPDTPIYIIHYKKRNNSEQENFKRF